MFFARPVILAIMAILMTILRTFVERQPRIILIKPTILTSILRTILERLLIGNQKTLKTMPLVVLEEFCMVAKS